MQEEARLRNIYSQVVLGYSRASFNGRAVFIRHFSPVLQGEIDAKYLEIEQQAIQEGVESEEDKLKQIKELGLWSEEEEKELEDLSVELAALKDTKGELVLPSQVEERNNKIKEIESKKYELESKKNELLGFTVERFCLKKINEFYVLKSIFKDEKFSIPFLSEEESAELDNEEILKLSSIYYKALEIFSIDNLKKIALNEIFQNVLYLADDNIFECFGRPVSQLTFFQTRIAEYGKYFKNILRSELNPPENVRKDPDKLMEWFDRSKNASKAAVGNSENKAIIGATKEDVETVAEMTGEKSVSLGQKAAELGKGRLSKEDLMNLWKNGA